MIGSFDSVVLAAVAAELEAWRGARLVRVTQPAPLEVLVELRAGGRSSAILCSADARWARVHLARAAAGGPRGPFAAMLQSRLAGARLVAVHQPPFERVLTLRAATDAGEVSLVAEIMGRHSNVLLVQDGDVAGALKPVPASRSRLRVVLPGSVYAPPPASRPRPQEVTAETLRAALRAGEAVATMLTTRLLGISPTMAREIAARAGLDPDRPAGEEAIAPLLDALRWIASVVERREFAPVVYLDGASPVGYTPFALRQVSGLVGEPVTSMSEAVTRVVTAQSAAAALSDLKASVIAAVRTALVNVARLEDGVRRALDDAREAADLQRRGELLLAYASQIPAGADAATVPDYADHPVAIPLDPTRTPVENAQALFARSGKLRRAVPALQNRLRALGEERAYLDSVLAMVAQAATVDEARAVELALAAEGYRRAARPTPPAAPAATGRTFALAEDATVLVGRSNRENDHITFKVAGPRDLWFHARGVSGAHVILRTGGRTPRPEETTQAAAIAAWFSRARGSASVAVDYTARAHVRKPKGSRPGVVIYEREQTVMVRPQAPPASTRR